MTSNSGQDEIKRPVYWDNLKKQLYWIEWEDTGNGEIAHRHYIEEEKTYTYIEPRY